jgi:hypothetical protein
MHECAISLEGFVTMLRNFDRLLRVQGGSSSVAERQLPKLNVAGSIPVSRSKISRKKSNAPSASVRQEGHLILGPRSF